MRALRVDEADARALFAAQLTGFLAACAGLSEIELLDPSRCRGWSRLEVLVHVRAGLDELAAGIGIRTDHAPDHDAAGYWASHPDDRDEDPVPHILWLRRTASAYLRPGSALRHLVATADRAAAAVAAAGPGTVLFQGKAMAFGDILATWVVELAVHELDLDAGGTPAGIRLARRTVEAVADANLPAVAQDVEAVVAGLGRGPWPQRFGDPGPFPVSL